MTLFPKAFRRTYYQDPTMTDHTITAQPTDTTPHPELRKSLHEQLREFREKYGTDPLGTQPITLDKNGKPVPQGRSA